ncbi:serine hydrolase [Streptomyces canarius]
MTSTLRKHLVMALGVATLLTAEVVPAIAQPAGPSPVEQLRRDTEAIHALGVSGVQARVVAPDGRQSVAASGTADLNTGRPVSSGGYFRMASTSKTLVATVVLQMEAEGRLSLDDTVDHWLPHGWTLVSPPPGRDPAHPRIGTGDTPPSAGRRQSGAELPSAV